MYSVASSPFNSFSQNLYGGWNPPKKLKANARSIIPLLTKYRFHDWKKNKAGYKGPSKDELELLFKNAPLEDQAMVHMMVPPPTAVKHLSKAQKDRYLMMLDLMSFPQRYYKHLKEMVSHEGHARNDQSRKDFLKSFGHGAPSFTPQRLKELIAFEEAQKAAAQKAKRPRGRPRKNPTGGWF
jgi:hypothetical protein